MYCLGPKGRIALHQVRSWTQRYSATDKPCKAQQVCGMRWCVNA